MVRNKHNTPGLIKYPFWQMALANPRATYACVNQGQAAVPREIARQSLCLDANIRQTLAALAM